MRIINFGKNGIVLTLNAEVLFNVRNLTLSFVKNRVQGRQQQRDQEEDSTESEKVSFASFMFNTSDIKTLKLLIVQNSSFEQIYFEKFGVFSSVEKIPSQFDLRQ